MGLMEEYEFRNTNGEIIVVRPHGIKPKDLEVRTKVMLDMLNADIDNARYDEYRALLTIKLYTKCLKNNREDLCGILGEGISTLMTRKIVSPLEDEECEIDGTKFL
jgi:hypothetical protein